MAMDAGLWSPRRPHADSRLRADPRARKRERRTDSVPKTYLVAWPTVPRRGAKRAGLFQVCPRCPAGSTLGLPSRVETFLPFQGDTFLFQTHVNPLCSRNFRPETAPIFWAILKHRK